MQAATRQAPQGLLTITRLARVSGVPATTIRYYEREGLLSPVGRTRAGYRHYDVDAAERLRFVRAAQSIGLPLRDVREMLDMGRSTPPARVRPVLEARLSEVEAKIKELTNIRDALKSALARCRCSGACCNVLVSLGVETGATNGDKDHDQHAKDRRRGGGGRGRAGRRVRDDG